MTNAYRSLQITIESEMRQNARTDLFGSVFINGQHEVQVETNNIITWLC